VTSPGPGARRPAPQASAPRFFDSEARRYDAAYDAAGLKGRGLRERMEVTLDLLGDRPGRVLDAGMGPGRLIVELDRRGWAVTGADGSEEMVAIARARLPAARDRLQQAMLERLPFPDGCFDAVVATGVVEYVEPPQRAVSEISRVLAPGGLAVISIPNRYEPHTAWRHEVLYPSLRLAKRVGLRARAPYRRRRPPSRRRFERLLAEASLEVERVAYVGRFALIAPLEPLFPRLVRSLTGRLGRSWAGRRHWLAAQLVFAARKQRPDA
jgi:SAM-dependent methyltransferase